MEIVLIFICGMILGTIIEWFSRKIPKEENQPIKNNFKKCCNYARRVINRRMLISYLVGLIYCLIYLKYKISIDFLKYSSVCSILLLIAFIDYKTQDVYFSTILLAIALNICFITIEFFNGADIRTYIMGAVFALVVSTILSSLKVFGWGDVEIFFVCGLLTGLNKTVIIMLTSIVICGLYGLFLMLKEKKILIKMRVAFGPYIVAALLFTIIFLK